MTVAAAAALARMVPAAPGGRDGRKRHARRARKELPVKVLVVGGGGREHALCWKLRQSPELTELYCAPGNPGIAAVADCVAIAAEEIHSLADFAQEAGIDLTIVGPELPLTLGIVDEFQARGLRIFGPKRHAAELEGSKVFAKEFLRRHAIPTADFEIVHDRAQAAAAAARFGFPVVLKADGLAAGKGVIVAADAAELEAALVTLFDERRFATAADRVVVEEFLEGEEVSFIAISDGERILPFATARDHKRLLDGDRGPNTGGMGAFSPSGLLSADLAAEDPRRGDAADDSRHRLRRAAVRRRALRRTDVDRRRRRRCSSSTPGSATRRRRPSFSASRTTCCRFSPPARSGTSGSPGCTSARRPRR